MSNSSRGSGSGRPAHAAAAGAIGAGGVCSLPAHGYLWGWAGVVGSSNIVN
eukprot:SAG22_NODE_728_length_7596_cov_342.279178_5_plen_51_part_00